MRHTIYVFHPTVKDFDDVLAPGRLKGVDAFERVAISGVTFSARGYLQRNHQTRPGWLAGVRPYCQMKKPKEIWNQSNSFIVAIRTTSGTVCAVTHGQGFLNLNKAQIIDGYGLDLAHRILKPTELKAIDSKGVGAGSLQKRHVSSRVGDLATFALNAYRDRIRRIEGKSNNLAFGVRFSGGTSCAITGPVTFPELGDLCEAIVAARAAPKNRRFAATEPYREVTDGATLKALQGKLQRELSHNKGADLGAFAPEIEDWTRVSEFKVAYGSDDFVPIDDLDPTQVAEHLIRSVKGPLDTSAIKIRGFDSDGYIVFDVDFESIVTFETSYGGKPYALSEGKWFLLDQDFVAGITQRIDEVQVITATNYLPAWKTTDTDEAAYNKRVQSQHGNRVKCLDRNTIAVDGRGPVEPCDLATLTGDLIHVKKWTASQAMSALLKQGENSAILVRNHQDFREGILNKLPATWRTQLPWKNFVADFRAPQFRIVYALPDRPTRNIPVDLPIFSKISLVETYSRLRADNFNVGVFHVRLPK